MGVTERAHAYLPIDRRWALLTGEQLPSRVSGSALEADLSGFTALTEALAQQLGEQRGAEELTRRLNLLYDGLIDEVHRYNGTVLGFSGDAITCWLDGDNGERAVTCARRLQQWIEVHGADVSSTDPRAGPRGGPRATMPGNLGSPRLKVAVATGSARRFLVGDPDIQLWEGVAGALVDEMAEVEHLAVAGEVVLAPSTRAALDGRAETDDRGALIAFAGEAGATPWPALDEEDDNLDHIRPWLQPAVFARLAAGQGDFLAELRPATALFLRFSGIRFEEDPSAIDRLDAYVRAVQSILRRYEATLVQLTIGDKGSYLYAAFGAPVAHEDDPARALNAALDLRRLGGRGGRGGLVDPVSIGVAAGRLRAGAYGGLARRTYGVLGDTVNLSARLMQAAGPGEIVATAEVRQSAAAGFRWASMADLTVKGKRRPVAVAKLVGRRGATRRHRRASAMTPLLGRRNELAQLHAALDATIDGRGQVVAVTAEAGMGKTKLINEFLASVDGRADVHPGECPAMGVHGSYVVWRPIWSRLLGAGERGPIPRRIEAAAKTLSRHNAALLPRLPVLATLLGLPIPDNDLTALFDAKVRKTALETLLADWLRSAVVQPMLFVLEDAHWIDPLSEDLLEVLGRSVRDLPVMVLVTQRPRGEPEGGRLAITTLPHYEEIALERLSDDEVAELVRLHLAGAQVSRDVATELARLIPRAEGNPFYAGELVAYVLDLGPRALDPARLAELPTSLQSLLLSRMDRLDEGPRSALKVASAVGRAFPVDLLARVHPALGTEADVRRQLSTLHKSDFVSSEDPLEAEYSFKHAMTQDVAYSTLPGATRAGLHGRIGRALEERAGEQTERHLDVLAYHFARGDDDGRRRSYLLRAGDAAQARYANRAAAEYYSNVLSLLEGAELGRVLLRLGRAQVLMGRWDDAASIFEQARLGAIELGDRVAEAWAETEQGELLRKQGRYQDAATRFEAARARLEGEDDASGEAEVEHLEGTLAAQQGELGQAREHYANSLDIRRRVGDRRGMARSLNGLGIVAEYEGQLGVAAGLYQEALSILVELGDTWGVAALTNNTGMTLLLQDRAAEARPFFERAVALQREIGDPHMLANFLSNLGDAAREMDQAVEAARCYHEGLGLARELGERWLIAYLLEDVALLSARRENPAPAIRMAAAAARLREEIGAPLPPDSLAKLDQGLEAARAGLPAVALAEAVAAGAALSLEQAVDEALAQTAENQPAGR